MAITSKVLLGILWAVLLVLSIYFLFDNVLSYFFGYRSRLFGDSFFSNQMWVVMHMAGGALLLILGPIQFWKWFRNKYLKLHRWLGKIYLIGAMFAGFSALRLGLISTCIPCRISLILLAIFLLLSAVAAWRAIKHKNIVLHQQFMIRTYVCALAFVMVRIDELVPLNFLFGSIADDTFNRTVNEYFFSFVPLLFTEIAIHWLPVITGKKVHRMQIQG